LSECKRQMYLHYAEREQTRDKVSNDGVKN